MGAALANPEARHYELPNEDLPWPLGGWLRRDVNAEAHSFEMGPDSQYAPMRGVRVYQGPKQMLLLVTIDMHPRFGDMLHASMSYPNRDPSWTEIKAMRKAVFSDMDDVMMVLPVEADWVNIHAHTFHLTTTPERWQTR
jgi:hypothetical protein